MMSDGMRRNEDTCWEDRECASGNKTNLTTNNETQSQSKSFLRHPPVISPLRSLAGKLTFPQRSSSPAAGPFERTESSRVFFAFSPPVQATQLISFVSLTPRRLILSRYHLCKRCINPRKRRPSTVLAASQRMTLGNHLSSLWRSRLTLCVRRLT